MFGRLLDIGEGQGAVLIGNVEDLIEPGDGVANVLGVGQRLLALFWEGEDRIGQVCFGGKLPNGWTARFAGPREGEEDRCASIAQATALAGAIS